MTLKTEKKSSGKWISQSIKLLIAGVLIYWVVRGINFSQLPALLTLRTLWFTLGCAAAIGIQILLTAVRWNILLEAQEIHLPFSRALSLTMQGIFFSLCMPGGAVGGDVVKAAFLVRETRSGQKLNGVTSIFIDRVTGMMALFLLGVVIMSICLKQILNFPPETMWPILILYGISIAGLGAGVALFLQDLLFRIPLTAKLLDFADRICRGRIRPILNSVAVYRKKPEKLAAAFFLSLFLSHPLLILGMILAALGVAGTFSVIPGAVLASVTGSIAAAVPVTPGGLGTRDKITQLILEMKGMDFTDASMTPLLYTLSLIAVSLCGALFFLMDSRSKKE